MGHLTDTPRVLLLLPGRSPVAAQELGRALHMAFFIWSPGALLTADCDQDVQQLCLSRRPNMAKTPGAVGTCLATIVRACTRLPHSALLFGRGTHSSPCCPPALPSGSARLAPARWQHVCSCAGASRSHCRLTDHSASLALLSQLEEMGDLPKGSVKQLPSGSGDGGAGADGAQDEDGGRPLPAGAKRALGDACRALVDVAQPPDLKRAFEASLSLLVVQVRRAGAPARWCARRRLRGSLRGS